MDINALLSGKNKIITAVMVIAIVGAVLLVGTQEGQLAANAATGDNASPGGGGKTKTNNTEPNATGTVLKTDGGGTMTMSIPYVGINVLEVEVKDHYTMPAGMHRIVVVINWDKTGWNLELSIGTGECPTSGVALAKQTGTTGPITIEYASEDGEALTEGMWFVHAKANDVANHRGQSITFTYTVTVFE